MSGDAFRTRKFDDLVITFVINLNTVLQYISKLQ